MIQFIPHLNAIEPFFDTSGTPLMGLPTHQEQWDEPSGTA
jgi:hypothetical protein